MTKNEAASVAQLTDEQIRSFAEAHGFYSGLYGEWQFNPVALLSFARALLAQAAPPAAPVQDREMIMRDVRSDVDHLGIGFYRTHNDGSLEYLMAHQVTIVRKAAAPAAPATGEMGAEPVAMTDEAVRGVLRNYFDVTDSQAANVAHDLRLITRAKRIDASDSVYNLLHHSLLYIDEGEPSNARRGIQAAIAILAATRPASKSAPEGESNA